MNHNRVVFLIPYFGRIPDYFELWQRSAEANPEFTFYLYTDLPFPVHENSNVQIKYTTFPQLQQRLRRKLGQHCKVRDPYKLCDYKPAYGMIFQEDIGDFEFWGFCDVDLIFGDIGKFVTDALLDSHDKLFDHGHFCIMRNDPRMNTLYARRYPRILDFDYMSRTNFICHFDENGTIAWAPEYDSSLRCYTQWTFYDVPYQSYRMLQEGHEVYVSWQNGALTFHNPGVGKETEIMYAHLQKRKMTGMADTTESEFVIFRTKFCNASAFADGNIEALPVDAAEAHEFHEQYKTKTRNARIAKLKQGVLKFRFFRQIYRWRERA